MADRISHSPPPISGFEQSQGVHFETIAACSCCSLLLTAARLLLLLPQWLQALLLKERASLPLSSIQPGLKGMHSGTWIQEKK